MSRQTLTAFILTAASLLVSGCDQADVSSDAPPPPGEASTPVTYAGTSLDDLIDGRAEEYRKVRREAFDRGVGAGIVRGAVIGILLDGSPASIVGGALIGGAVGAAAADQMASKLTLDHKNYLVRRWSLEQVIVAAREDTADTSFDLVLSKKAVDASRARGLVAVSRAAFVDLQEMAKISSLRLLSLRQIREVYADQPGADSLEEEYAAQASMVAQLKANIAELDKLGWDR